ncbi:DMT family transporter [Bacillus sp. 03113]|uniref:DMT family transporter n=1 Tax=Bacillus sp. 03113 TaxID=2578211 RepID=UPI001143D80D|nr:DMT family transporter [Bacillus sp. 03113]
MKNYKVLSFLLLANLFWAGNYVFGKYVVAEMPPLQLTFSRWLFAIFLLFPIAHVVEKPNWKQVWKEWKILLIMSLLGIVGYNFLLYEALKYTSSMNAALVNSINPAVIVLFASLFLKERISIMNGFGLIISLFGVLLVLTKGQIQQLFLIHYNIGDLLMLAAILVWTFYSILGKKMKKIPPIASTAVSALFSVLMLLPFILTFGVHLPPSRESALGLLYIAIFPSVFSFIFWNASVREIGPSRAGIFLNLITVFTAILSVLLGNSITFTQILGGILVFLGVYFTSQKKNPAKLKQLRKGILGSK